MAAKTIHALSGYNWFPGHMAKGMREALNKAQRCHLVIEVHDARIPFTGRNEKLKFSENRKILVLNKYDLIDRRRKLFDEIEGVPVIWTNSKSKHHSSMGKLREKIISMTQDQKRLHDGIKVMIVGMPNVGKSSLINSLRRDAFGEGTKAAATSPYPGHTKMLSTFIKISGDPLIKMYDTPGIMIPNIKNKEMALKLAAIGKRKPPFPLFLYSDFCTSLISFSLFSTYRNYRSTFH